MHLTFEKLPSDLTAIHLNLRCIEEAYDTRKMEEDPKQESVVGCYQIYHDTQTIRGELVNETDEIQYSWNLPDAKDLTSTPRERLATFWELEVQGERSGLDYHSRFFLPVYAKAQ